MGVQEPVPGRNLQAPQDCCTGRSSACVDRRAAPGCPSAGMGFSTQVSVDSCWRRAPEISVPISTLGSRATESFVIHQVPHKWEHHTLISNSHCFCYWPRAWAWESRGPGGILAPVYQHVTWATCGLPGPRSLQP